MLLLFVFGGVRGCWFVSHSCLVVDRSCWFDWCDAFKVVVRVLTFNVINAVIHVLAVCDFEDHDFMSLPVFHDDAVIFHSFRR